MKSQKSNTIAALTAIAFIDTLKKLAKQTKGRCFFNPVMAAAADVADPDKQHGINPPRQLPADQQKAREKIVSYVNDPKRGLATVAAKLQAIFGNAVRAARQQLIEAEGGKVVEGYALTPEQDDAWMINGTPALGSPGITELFNAAREAQDDQGQSAARRLYDVFAAVEGFAETRMWAQLYALGCGQGPVTVEAVEDVLRTLLVEGARHSDLSARTQEQIQRFAQRLSAQQQAATEGTFGQAQSSAQ